MLCSQCYMLLSNVLLTNVLFTLYFLLRTVLRAMCPVIFFSVLFFLCSVLCDLFVLGFQLVSYPARWSFSFTLGPLHWSFSWQKKSWQNLRGGPDKTSKLVLTKRLTDKTSILTKRLLTQYKGERSSSRVTNYTLEGRNTHWTQPKKTP